MAIFLLDTNILIALAWPHHPHNQAAHQWMKSRGRDRWATCPITECGFIRISSNKNAIPVATTPAVAIGLLDNLTRDLEHEFWEDDVSLRNVSLRREAIQGHRQITDAYLLALCLRRNGRFATFDQGVLSLASTDEERAAVFVVPT